MEPLSGAIDTGCASPGGARGGHREAW